MNYWMLFFYSMLCGCAGFVLALLGFSTLRFAGASWAVILFASVGGGVGCFFVPLVDLTLRKILGLDTHPLLKPSERGKK